MATIDFSLWTWTFTPTTLDPNGNTVTTVTLLRSGVIMLTRSLVVFDPNAVKLQLTALITNLEQSLVTRAAIDKAGIADLIVTTPSASPGEIVAQKLQAVAAAKNLVAIVGTADASAAYDAALAEYTAAVAAAKAT